MRPLQYAEQGPAVLPTVAPDPDAAPESPFAEGVLAVLRDWDCDVQPQVGVTGFRTDTAVRRPGDPGSYALGVERDGAMYHSSPAATTVTGFGRSSCAAWDGTCTGPTTQGGADRTAH
ncbi:hypothetical protein ACIRP5_05265 [Streptomyces sp. NPDC101221]|uniref:hypothetical protein n=1 Tax=Streptomyces sp. NPDC101221 TaxID=3366132 RepID=UPI0037F61707